MRLDGRKPDQIRNIKFTRGYTKYAEGSVLVETGDTRVLCNATIEDGVPAFLAGQKRGWLTAEYSMLPRATGDRNIREVNKGRAAGRTMEIQRLIGRSLRSIVDLSAIGERTIIVDCDVIQADGGTRTAAINGGFIAVVDALNYLCSEKFLEYIPVIDFLGAVSAVKLDNGIILDPDFAEDSSAEVDINIVMTGKGEIIEVQGTAEGTPFSKAEMVSFLDLSEKGIMEIVSKQKDVLGSNTKFLEKR